MATINDIKERGHLALLECPDCTYKQTLDAFIEENPDRVDTDEEELQMGCPDCGNDTVEVGPSAAAREKMGSNVEALFVDGIEEMERMFGQ